jgi:hypothetical protein
MFSKSPFNKERWKMISEDEAQEKARTPHPELEDWGQEDYDRAEAVQGVNWFLHLKIDAVVFRRASADSLPDGEVIRELRKSGKSEKDAIHMIAALVVEDLWERLRMPAEKGEAAGKFSVETQATFDALNKSLNQKIRKLLHS